MSLSVINTGYSNSQTQSLTTSATNTSVGNPAKIVDRNGTTVDSAATELSEEARAHLRDLIDKANTKYAQQGTSLEEELAKQLRDRREASAIPTGNSGDPTQSVNLVGTPIVMIPGVNMNHPLFTDRFLTDESAVFGVWANNLKADSGISKDDFLDLVHSALSDTPLPTWSSVTDNLELPIKQAKLEALKNRYIDSNYQQQAGQDITQYVSDRIAAFDRMEKGTLESVYQYSTDTGDTQRAEAAQRELQKNSEGISTSQLERKKVFALTESGSVDSWFDQFRNYVSRTFADPYTKSDYLSAIGQFQAQWQQFQQQLG
ncbi:hypothetical protein [Dickeya fangzhongdai]|uniref:hypothetical protein n=1 Tax=Dickeya fangzhongdai TaxID=1778540 RepID=UPI0004F889C0|nr:hypothetical protein [Dickeya fangzhongdai]AIR69485.1 hypothetical protein LH89_09825 [Dickeya fangzhongdai]KGT99415.1 hypothetical protein NM75_04760 [Dickeya fangzhongdai]KHN58163.1 hypothetical protein OI70_07750 [Dickeya fangzhongdai]